MSSPKPHPSCFAGSLAEAYEKNLLNRLEEVLARLRKRKSEGHGAVARPEANIGILRF